MLSEAAEVGERCEISGRAKDSDCHLVVVFPEAGASGFWGELNAGRIKSRFGYCETANAVTT
jgi:hypothetical protein